MPSRKRGEINFEAKMASLEAEDITDNDVDSRLQRGVANLGLNVLMKDQGQINELSTENHWKCFPVPVVVDGGASESVPPSSWFANYPTVPGKGSQSGEFYRAAKKGTVFIVEHRFTGEGQAALEGRTG